MRIDQGLQLTSFVVIPEGGASDHLKVMSKGLRLSSFVVNNPFDIICSNNSLMQTSLQRLCCCK